MMTSNVVVLKNVDERRFASEDMEHGDLRSESDGFTIHGSYENRPGSDSIATLP